VNPSPVTSFDLISFLKNSFNIIIIKFRFVRFYESIRRHACYEMVVVALASRLICITLDFDQDFAPATFVSMRCTLPAGCNEPLNQLISIKAKTFKFWFYFAFLAGFDVGNVGAASHRHQRARPVVHSPGRPAVVGA